MVNCFKNLVALIPKGEWRGLEDFAVMASYNLKLAGISWETNDQLALILTEFQRIGFVEISRLTVPGSPLGSIRIREKWYDQSV